MFSFSRFAAILAGLLGLLLGSYPAAWAHLQTGTSPTEEPAIYLRGTVVDGVTGKPIAHALVNSLDRRLATMTNTDGAYALKVVRQSSPGGQNSSASSQGELRIMMQASKPGYLPPGPVLARLDQTSVEVTLKLMPAATISGRVSADGPDAPGNVPIALLWHSANNGQFMWVVRNMQHTDRNGTFRFAELQPGEYAVMSTEWRGAQPLPPMRDVITQEYPPVFFGDAANLEGSTRLRLHYGDAFQADLHLHSARYYPVFVPVGNPGAGVDVNVNGGTMTSGFSLGYQQDDHAVEGWLPTGTYTLQVTGQGPQQTFGVAVVHVADAPLHTGPLELVPPLPITVRIHTAFSGKQAPQERTTARVYLQPVAQQMPFATGMPLPGEDTVMLSNVAPGQYHIHVEPPYGYVAAVQSGGVDLLAQPLTVAAGEAVQPIDVDLRDDTGKVQGTASADGAPLPPGAFISFLPASPTAAFTTAVAGPTGEFSSNSVTPGNYVVLATATPLWQFPFRDPDALRAVAGHGLQLTVAPNSTQSVEVPFTPPNSLELP